MILPNSWSELPGAGKVGANASELFMKNIAPNARLPNQRHAPLLHKNKKLELEEQDSDNCDSAIGDDEHLVKFDILTELPCELRNRVLLYIGPSRELMVVCRTWNLFFQDKSYWKHQYITRFSPHLKSFLLNTNKHEWSEMYWKRLRLLSNWKNAKVQALYLQGHTDSVYCLQFDKSILLTGSRDRTIKLWDLKTFECIRTQQGHQGSVLCLQYNSQIIVSGSSDCRIILWDFETGNLIKILEGHLLPVLDIQLTDKYIVSSSKDSKIKIWSLESGQCIRTIGAHQAAVNSIHVHGDKFVSASGDGDVRLWDLETGNFLRVFKGHTRGLACVEYDGKIIVSGSNDNTIKVWNAETGECIRTLTEHTDLVRTLSFNKNFMVSGSYDYTVKIWDHNTGECLVSMENAHVNSWVFHLKLSESRIISSSQV